MNDAIRPQPGILDIALYEGGKAAVEVGHHALRGAILFGDADAAESADFPSVRLDPPG